MRWFFRIRPAWARAGGLGDDSSARSCAKSLHIRSQNQHFTFTPCHATAAEPPYHSCAWSRHNRYPTAAPATYTTHDKPRFAMPRPGCAMHAWVCVLAATEQPFLSPSTSHFLQAGTATAPAAGENVFQHGLELFPLLLHAPFRKEPPLQSAPTAGNTASLPALGSNNLHKVRSGVADERVLELFLRSIARGIVWIPRWASGAQTSTLVFHER